MMYWRKSKIYKKDNNYKTVGLINTSAQGILKASLLKHKRKTIDTAIEEKRGPYEQRALSEVRDRRL